MVRIPEPSEMDEYFQVRYNTLRKTWNQPIGSERDKDDNTSIHIAAFRNHKIIGVCRLQFNSDNQAQLRYMGIVEEERGSGVGDKMISFAEEIALENGRRELILHAREKAVNFYKKNGYEIKEKSYLMWGEIQHFLMRKLLQ